VLPYSLNLSAQEMLAGNRLSWGSLPLRDLNRTSPLSASLPTSLLCSVLRLSQPLDGFLLVRPCDLISCRCHVQGSALQGFLFPISGLPSSGLLCPLAVHRRSFGNLTCRSLMSYDSAPRLSSDRKYVSHTRFLHLMWARFPLGLLASSGFSFLLPWDDYSPSPLMLFP